MGRPSIDLKFNTKRRHWLVAPLTCPRCKQKSRRLIGSLGGALQPSFADNKRTFDR